MAAVEPCFEKIGLFGEGRKHYETSSPKTERRHGSCGMGQLRQEITRIQTDLTGCHTTKRAADAEVQACRGAAKAELVQAQENKRRLSEGPK